MANNRVVLVVGVTDEHIAEGYEVFPSHKDDVATIYNMCQCMFIAIKKKTGIDAEHYHKDYRSYIRIGDYDYMINLSLSTWMEHCVEKQGHALPSNLVFYITDGQRYVRRERVYNPNRISKSRARRNLVKSLWTQESLHSWENRHPYNGYPHYYYSDGHVR